MLCSLRPRATARQLFRAFATKPGPARTNGAATGAVVEDVRDYGLDEEDEANDDVDRLAFILCVGPCRRPLPLDAGADGLPPFQRNED